MLGLEFRSRAGNLLVASLAVMTVAVIAIVSCVEAPDAPVRDNPFQGDPFELSAALTSEGVVLTWKAVSVSGLTGYKVYRSMRADSGFSSRGTVSADTLRFADADIYSDSTYFYKVAALVGGSESASSATESVPVIGSRICLSDSAWVASDTGSTSPGISVTNCNNAGILRWTATEDVNWLTLSRDTGNTPATITMSADSNTTGSLRSGVITVRSSCLDSTTTTISVSQPTTGSELRISVSVWPAPDTGGTSAVVEVTNCGNASTFAWSVATSADWLGFSDSAGMAPGDFTITADSNLTGAIREDTVTVTAPGVDGSPVLIVVSQTPAAILCVTPSTWSVADAGGTSPSTEVTNCGSAESFSWSVGEDADWLNLSVTNGTTPGSFTITADSNLSGTGREDTVTVSAPGMSGSPILIAVNQQSVVAVLCVSDTSWTAPDTGGTSDGVLITNCGNDVTLSWIATENLDWLSISHTSGTTPGSFAVTVDSNWTGSDRTGAVIITALGIPDSMAVITVTQPTTEPVLCLSESSWEAPVLGGTSDVIMVTNCGNNASFNWQMEVASVPSWLSVSGQSGNVPIGILIYAEANKTDSSRTGLLTFTAAGIDGSPQTVTVSQKPHFSAAVSYEVEDDPISVFSIDFNNDGANDLVTANWGDWWDVSVLLGNGDGTFQSAVNYVPGRYATSVFSIDFNADGHNDLAVANEDANRVSILLGNGDGTFQSTVNCDVAGIEPKSVFSIDFDGDGHNDLATANGNSSNVSILLGNGDGTFQSAVNYPAGGGPYSVFSIDFDGDGHNDLATANRNSSNVSILLGNGDGTFQSAVNYAVGDAPFSVFSIDLDGDGDVDLATANFGSGSVSILLGNGAGSFQSAVNYAVGDDPFSTFSIDFDGDGDNDLATANRGSSNVSILLGNGDGTFQSAVNYPAGGAPYSVFSIDLDGDGDNDLAVANAFSNNVSILINNTQ